MAASITAQLEQLAQKKAKAEADLRDVEKQVYNLETSYLNDSAAHGNILRGFEGFLGPAKPQKCVSRVGGVGFDEEALLRLTLCGWERRGNRARNFKTEERLFSLSSTTSPAVRARSCAWTRRGVES
jgi:chromatin modification-related protein EAF6